MTTDTPKQPQQPQPLYRVIAEHAFIGGVDFYRQGTELEFTAWPNPRQVEPVNEGARRITDYFTERAGWIGFPKSPWRTGHGFYLPGLLPRMAPPSVSRTPFNPPGSEIAGLVPADRAAASMPQYQLSAGGQVGHKKLEAGEPFAFVGWPPEYFEPANAEAERVAAYHAEHKSHPGLLSSPWCCYRADVYLPALRQLAPGRPQALDYSDRLEAIGKGSGSAVSPEDWSALQPRSTAPSGVNRARPITQEQE